MSQFIGFGNGSDGDLTISSNTTQSPIDSAATGTISTKILSATNVSFAAGQIILIHQTQGTGAGQWEINQIDTYVAGTITTIQPLTYGYTTGAQVIVLQQYNNVTVNSGITWSAKAWNGTVGGILTFMAMGTVSIPGTISGNYLGFRGGVGTNSSNTASNQGEGTVGAGTTSTAANGNGGGGATRAQSGADKQEGAGAGGGGNQSTGGTGDSNGDLSGRGTSQGGTGGATVGDSACININLGGGGGGAAGQEKTGGYGGAIGIIFSANFVLTGSMTSIGQNGDTGGSADSGASGAGAGGSFLIKARTASIGTNLFSVSGGARAQADSSGSGAAHYSGTGGSGYVRIEACTITGSSSVANTQAGGLPQCFVPGVML